VSGGQIQNAMTVDVEDYFHVAALAEVIKRDDWSRMEYRAEANTHYLLNMFAESGMRATFFFLGWVAKRSPQLVKAVHAAGHEIGCHGMSHELVYQQTPEVFRSETTESKHLLEDLTGSRVSGYRAASWSITGRSLWALDIIADLQFEYDSSIFPIRHDIYGIPDAPTKPGRMRTPQGAEVIEFPPSTATMLGARVPVAGGGYFRLLPYWFTRMGLRQINHDRKEPFIFYLHPWEIDPGQPVVRAGLKSRFRHYTNLSKTSARLRRLIDEFRFGTVREVLVTSGLLPA
jgi:polysaccharide deacetylase family protein (PEP-CTERM system associated)